MPAIAPPAGAYTCQELVGSLQLIKVLHHVGDLIDPTYLIPLLLMRLRWVVMWRSG
jgi:hypothetical protein